MIDASGLSKIKITSRVVGGEYISEVYEWIGESRLTAFSYYMWDELSKKRYNFPSLDRDLLGVVFKFGQFMLVVVEDDKASETILCERIAELETE